MSLCIDCVNGEHEIPQGVSCDCPCHGPTDEIVQEKTYQTVDTELERWYNNLGQPPTKDE